MMHHLLQNYPGKKTGAGQLQQIISQIPKCETFVEIMCGSSVISRTVIKTGCKIIINDIDKRVIDLNDYAPEETKRLVKMNTDFSQVFNRLRNEQNIVFFCDPPYLMETRSYKGKLYKYEWSENDHRRFLKFVTKIKLKPVIIVHYPCPLYDKALKGWRQITYKTMTRGGLRDERLYMNFPQPVLLQCPGHIGENFTDRQRIKRKVQRLITRLKNEPDNERAAILTSIIDHYGYVIS